MKAAVRRMVEADSEAAVVKREAAQRLLKEVAASNDAMLLRKAEARKEEEAADAAIVEDVKQKNAKEQVWCGVRLRNQFAPPVARCANYPSSE